jgi:ArsR family transcriptional regulator, arsenate/arsenite/antimonite-responsive transcriptional repressor / arsenate reductase (thioredoxin)
VERDQALADPPTILSLVAHPLRWRLLHELTRSDRAVRELTSLVGEPQNLVSYHLRQLRDGGLVTARRSAADGRDSYYAIDLVACRDGFGTATSALHPGLSPTSPPPSSTGRRVRRRRVLFLCTGNSARSQMAEALLVQMSEGTVDARSAGSRPKPLHANAVKVMRRRGIDIGTNRSKHVDELLGQRFDIVITLCDRVREVCPEFPSHPELVHWSVPDPALEGDTDRATSPAFERTAAELERRISFLLHTLTTPPARRITDANR